MYLCHCNLRIVLIFNRKNKYKKNITKIFIVLNVILRVQITNFWHIIENNSFLLCNNEIITYFSLPYNILKHFYFVRMISHMWTLVHPLNFRWITETIQDILWLLRYPKMTPVGHPWNKVCCVGMVALQNGSEKN